MGLVFLIIEFEKYNWTGTWQFVVSIIHFTKKAKKYCCTLKRKMLKKSHSLLIVLLDFFFFFEKLQ